MIYSATVWPSENTHFPPLFPTLISDGHDCHEPKKKKLKKRLRTAPSAHVCAVAPRAWSRDKNAVTYLARSGPGTAVPSVWVFVCLFVHVWDPSQISQADTLVPHSSEALVTSAAGASHQTLGTYFKGVVTSLVTLIGLHRTSQGLQNDLSLH